MKIKVTRAFCLAGGQVQTVGKVITVDDKYGRELIAMNKAAIVIPARERAEAQPTPVDKVEESDA